MLSGGHGQFGEAVQWGYITPPEGTGLWSSEFLLISLVVRPSGICSHFSCSFLSLCVWASASTLSSVDLHGVAVLALGTQQMLVGLVVLFMFEG